MKDKFKSFNKDTCRICESSNLFSYLDLGDQPPSNSFIEVENLKNEQSFPLNVQLCTFCGLSQLSTVVSSKDIFDDYLYFSSTSKALVNHYKEMTENILNKINPLENSLIVDIGCNDGITLKCYPKNKFNILGIEPSSTSDAAIKDGLNVEKEFFSNNFSKILIKKYGKASIITATNVFAHVDNIRDFVSGIRNFLDAQGVFIIEFPYLKNMLEENLFDIIYHEHLSYLSITPLKYLFSLYDLKIFDITEVDVGASGPGLRIYVSHKNSKFLESNIVEEFVNLEKKLNYKTIAPYEEFSKNVSLIKERIIKIINDLNSLKKKVGAFGAPAKGNTMLNYLNIDKKKIKAVADNTPSKIGKLTPGTHIPIISDEDFKNLDIEYALLLSWNYLDFFLNNSDFIKSGGKFIVPFPEPKVLPK